MPPTTTPKPYAKLYLSSDTVDGVFGDGKWELLRCIADEGSIQNAARRLGRGYRKAWDDIRRAERGLGQALVTRRRGGADGGETVLTAFGTRLLASWERYRRAMDTAMDTAYAQHLAPVVETGRSDT